MPFKTTLLQTLNLQRSLAAFLALCLLFSPARAHTPHDDVFNVALSPNFAEDGTVYTLTRSSVLKSTERGANWRRMVKGLDNIAMLVDLELASDGETLYVSSLGEGVYISTDAGESWRNASQGLDDLHIAQISAAPDNPNLAYAMTVRGALFLTQNGGAQWAPVEGPFGTLTALLAGERGALLVGDAQGRLFQNNGLGAQWEKLHEIDGEGPITAIALHDASAIALGTAAGQVHVSGAEDGGFMTSKSSMAKDAVTALAFSPNYARDKRLFASTWETGVYCSANAGKSWRACDKNLTTDTQAKGLGRPSFGELALSPNFAKDKTLYVAAFDGLFASNNRGGKWALIETFPADYLIGIAASPNFADDSQLLLTNMLWGIYASEDKGDTWRSMNTRVLNDYARGNGFTRLFNPVYSPGFATDRTVFTSTWYEIYKSSDAGATWREIEPVAEEWWGEKGHHALSMALSPNFADDMTVIAGTNWGKIIRSTDAGESFNAVTDAKGNAGAVVFSPNYANDGIVLVGDVQGVHRSVDGGETWSFAQITDPDRFYEPVISPAYLSDELDGFTFFLNLEREKVLSTVLAISPNFATDGTAFAAGAEGLFRSSDAGATWTAVTGAPFEGRRYVEAVAVSPDFAADGLIIVSLRGKGLYRSTDRGQSFEPFAEELIENQIMFSHFSGVTPKFPPIVFSPDFKTDRTLFAMDGTQLYRSVDAGDSWAELVTPDPETSARFFTWYLANVYPYRNTIILLGGAMGLLFAVGAYQFFRRPKPPTA